MPRRFATSRNNGLRTRAGKKTAWERRGIRQKARIRSQNVFGDPTGPAYGRRSTNLAPRLSVGTDRPSRYVRVARTLRGAVMNCMSPRYRDDVGHRSRARWRTRRVGFGIALATVALLSGCANPDASLNDGEAGQKTQGTAAAPNPPGSDGGTAMSDVSLVTESRQVAAEESNARPSARVPTETSAGREVIYTATAEVEVVNATKQAAQIRRNVIAAGGWVLSDERSETTAQMVVKVPPKSFDATLISLASAGQVRSGNRRRRHGKCG